MNEKFNKDILKCPDLKEYSYEFENIGYCPYGKDYNIKRIVIKVVPNDTIPDVDDVLSMIKKWTGVCVEEATETRAQLIFDSFWNMCKPRKMTLNLYPGGSSPFGYGCVFERGE